MSAKNTISSREVTNEGIKSEILQYTTPNDIFNQKRTKFYSQHGEEGVLEYIFEMVSTTNRYYVEFGAANYPQLSNTASFQLNHGWNGLLLERDRNKPRPKDFALNFFYEEVTASNINEVFKKYHVPPFFDLLSIDIDSHDYWVWKALRYRPRVVIIETNPGISNDLPLAMCKDVSAGPHNYFGGNLHAFYNLASKKGYEFVTAVEYNAIFIERGDFHKLNISPISRSECLSSYRPPESYWASRFDYDKDWCIVD